MRSHAGDSAEQRPSDPDPLAPIDLILRLEIAPASVSAMRLDDWGVQITGVNDRGSGSAS